MKLDIGDRVMSNDEEPVAGEIIATRYGFLSGSTYYLVRWDDGIETECTEEQLRRAEQQARLLPQARQVLE